MTGFGNFDRYDFMMYLLFSTVWVGALVLGVPLWALVIIMFVMCVIAFIRHFDEIMWH
jgi:hypothetical protein